MYEIHMVLQDINVPQEAETIKKIIPLLKSVFGYNDNEIKIMIDNFFSRPFAKNLTKEQVQMAAQPFYDVGAPIIISEYDNNGTLINAAIPYYYEFFNLAKQPPKSHYYDEPVISRDHLVAPDYVPSKPTIELNPQPTTPTITCPTCGSTNTRKMGSIERGASILTFGIFSKKINKTFKCQNCGYTW